MPKINIAVAGGPCTGKSTLAAYLFAMLKMRGLYYDLLLAEDKRRKPFEVRGAFDRFYVWRLHEREELNSSALDGFITDAPLFHLYSGALAYASEPRDRLAIAELLSMCLELNERYQLIAIARNPEEIPYQNVPYRKSTREQALRRHELTHAFVEHLWPEKIVLVEGPVDNRGRQIMERFDSMRQQS